jgi:GT2 family glycosyltransferase
MTSIAVVILNYNGEKLLRQFLPSVIQHSHGAQIYVADNGSSDQSLQLLADEFKPVITLALGRNYGFCGGYNAALRQIKTDYYVLLNSDVEVTERWLEPLRNLLDTEPDVSAVQPKILSYTNKDLFEYAGAGGGFIDTLGYPFCRGRVFDHVEQDSGQYDDERPVFWSSGACMMIRADTFHQHNGFDEDLFAHMEEIDLCWKINRSKQRVYYTGMSRVYHLGAGTLGYHHPRKTYLNFRNGLCLIFKHLDTWELMYKLPLRLALDWLAAGFFLLKGQGKNAGSVLRAHKHFFAQWSSLRRKRHLIRRMYPSYPKENILGRLIILDYYLRKQKTITLQ